MRLKIAARLLMALGLLGAVPVLLAAQQAPELQQNQQQDQQQEQQQQGGPTNGQATEPPDQNSNGQNSNRQDPGSQNPNSQNTNEANSPGANPETPGAQAPAGPDGKVQGETAKPNGAEDSTVTAGVRAGHVVPEGKIELPVGTHIPLVLHNGISTRTSRVGDPVYFETLFPIMQDGKIVVPAGSYVSGEVTESKRPGRVKGRGEIMLRLETLILPNAYMVRFDGTPSGASTGGNETTTSEGKIEGDSSKKADVGTMAKTTAAGAGIGGLATRSVAGAGIGAGAGLAAGLAAVMLTRGPEAELPRGSTVEAVLDRPLDFDAAKITFTNPGQASTLAGPSNREPGRVNPF